MEISSGKNRLSYVDDVRSLVIFLVVMLHASVTYSGIGGWYIIENRSDSLDIVSKAIMGFFNSFNQAWFMGIMFFFGGYFAADGLARKGPGKFVRDRLLRLGIPLLGFTLVINPLMMYFIAYPERFQANGRFLNLYFGSYIDKGWFLPETGPLWFAETLLIFSLVLALVTKVCAFFTTRDAVSPAHGRAPSVAGLLVLVLLTAAGTFGVRLFWPMGTGWMNLQFCFFVSYIVLFLLGIRGAAGGWFAELTRGRSSRWFWAVICAGIPGWIALMLLGGVVTGNMASINGGLTVQSAAYSLWESFTAIGMCLGLTALFANRTPAGKQVPPPGPVSRFLSANSFSVYVFHPVFLIGSTKLFAEWILPPPLKALVVGLIAFSASLGFAGLIIRRIPGIRTYF